MIIVNRVIDMDTWREEGIQCSSYVQPIVSYVLKSVVYKTYAKFG